MSHNLRQSLTLGIAALSLAALTIPLSGDSGTSLERLDALLQLYDREPADSAKDKLGGEIDRVAHQRYATVSRLYWYTDLVAAEAAAQKLGRPILHLRMLGRLDEDLSCANSRLFRATLYANREISQFLREHFVLYWSSERPVPRVTIDFGDGRKLERTITGNSAHYVLDDRGNVLDVLPGLYAPVAFRHELDGSLELAAQARGKSDSDRAALVAKYHQDRVTAVQRDWERLAGTPWIPGLRQLMTERRVESAFAAAQRATVAKAAMEVPAIRVITKGIAPEALPADQVEMWSAAGQSLYGIGASGVIDAASRSLVVRLHNALPANLHASNEQLDQMIARLEQTIVADTALNQLRLRPMIEREIVRRGGSSDFETLNHWIYAEVFRTPKEDAWLGLLSHDVFTGVPGDGVVIGK